ncbi:MAG TPA: LacI family DNA-binding transcriptional regulator [Beijerinckiaceae bacterium]|nr:LacI family DNA-binding transcriptional regulator [Beijerinckiaceae bacterium]
MATKRQDRITIADVARRAGVSTATAGRVLGGYGYASEEIRSRVRKSAEALGYRPNLLARGLITGRTKTIGVVAGDVQSPFYASVLRGISDVARAEGFGVIVTNSDERTDREVEAVQLLLEKQVDGLIVAPSDLLRPAHLHAAVEGGWPIVQIDRVVAGLAADSVTVDNRGAAREAVAHLIAVGHRRIGIVAELERSEFPGVEAFVRAVAGGLVPTASLFPSWQRLYGYLDAHRDAGLSVDPGLIARVGEYSVGAGREETLKLLRHPHRPSALFTADGLMSAAAMDAITTQGIAIPGDLSLVCFDDLDWMRFSKPGVTAIVQPLIALGEAAATIVLARIKGECGADRHVVLATSLAPRGSVATP